MLGGGVGVGAGVGAGVGCGVGAGVGAVIRLCKPDRKKFQPDLKEPFGFVINPRVHKYSTKFGSIRLYTFWKLRHVTVSQSTNWK